MYPILTEILLHKCLIALYISGTLMILIVGGFLAKLLYDMSKLVQNLDSTVDIVKEEAKPILSEISSTMSGINTIVNSFDKNVNGASKFLGGFAAAGLLAFSKARLLSKGVLKKTIVWLISLVKLLIKK